MQYLIAKQNYIYLFNAPINGDDRNMTMCIKTGQRREIEEFIRSVHTETSLKQDFIMNGGQVLLIS